MGKAIQFKDSENEKVYVCPYFPIGSVYLSVVNTNPTKWFGGTWEQIAKGRTLVGVDTSQTEFNTVKKTGGEKTHKMIIDEMPSHSFNGYLEYPNGNVNIPGWSIRLNYEQSSQSVKGGQGIITETLGKDLPHNNLQPYFTCYIWLRTA